MADKRQVTTRVIKAAQNKTIIKSDTLTNLNGQPRTYEVFLAPEYELHGLKLGVNHSTILPQCIRAYKNNIAGFGIGIKYRDDYTDETAEMKAEYTKVEEIVDLLNMEMLTKEVFEKIIEKREKYGIAYLEVLRNGEGDVVQVELIEEIESISKTALEEPYITIDYYYKGRKIEKNKKFRRYKQEKLGKTVYFKEFGDPRFMDKLNGSFKDDVDISKQANEILEFKVGEGEYGTVRWVGQINTVSGSRKAEHLNKSYFEEGRHTPLMIIVKGGTLSEESWEKLQTYMNNIKGEEGQHSFLVMETEDSEYKTSFENTKPVEIEIKDMASMLQKDELFQDYLDNSRKKVQSSFLLPDLYTGYTTDFNRATAQAAMEVTEKQVFVPERKSLAWQINNKLLNGYQLKYVEIYFKAPDITNPDDMMKVLNIAERAGGITPNIAKEITFMTLGKEHEDYEEEWANTPIAIQKIINTAVPQIDTQIQKAEKDKDTDVVAVMKEVRKLLMKMSKER